MRTGFTLVELMMVVSIIGMLLAVAAPSFVHAREGARAKSCQENLKQIESAKERWAMDNHRDATDTATMAQLAVPGVYMRSAPVCPAGGSYTVGRLDQVPTCSLGGTPGGQLAHVRY
jgi:prepilin-type N-terminal cleavage/methylation domain-containing protein